ncbi:MAG: FAD-dependent oxidoreductase [Planctomycetaceae bacterium]
MREVDYIIVGQGLAGTCLAWELRSLGQSVVVIDRGTEITSSRIAAGLITPVTGQRLVKTWRWEELRATAWEFYRRMEIELRRPLLRETAMVKVFTTEQEREYFEKRRSAPEYTGLLREGPALPPGILAPLGSCELLSGGQLNVADFLNGSRERWTREGVFLAGELRLPEDVQLHREGEAHAEPRVELDAGSARWEPRPPAACVTLPRLGLQARSLIFCQGFDAHTNPWFSNVEFNAARGEMLLVRIAEWTETRIIHGGVWIAPAGLGLSRVGATYDWAQLDSGPTPQGRESLVTSLGRMLTAPLEIIDHQTAVRPILKQLNPVIGLHPHIPQLGYMNGLASKGSLQAPFFARQFARHLVMNTPIEREVDIQHRDSWPASHS